MISLAQRASARFFSRHPWQLALAIVGIALGVAVVVAVDLANASARLAFQLSVNAVAGRATHEIVGGARGLDDSLYRKLKVDAGIRSAAPIVDGYAQARGETLHIVGVAPFAEAPMSRFKVPNGVAPGNLITHPGTAWLGRRTAARLHVKRGGRLVLHLDGRRVPLRITGLIGGRRGAITDGLLVTDIATAQQVLDEIGRLDRIDLRLPGGEAGRREAARIRALLPPGAGLESTAARRGSLLEMTRAFSINLTAMSLLALLVGMFLIYNTMTFSVLQRRTLIANLRALGVTRGGVMRLILGEALLIGVAGTAIGLPLGLVLGRVLVHMVTRTINDLYFVLTVNRLLISALPLVKGALLGVGATLVAATGPALEAASTTPRLARSRAGLEQRIHRLAPRLALTGVVVMALAGASFLVGRNVTAGFVGVFFLIVGFTLTVPVLVSRAARVGAALLQHMAGVQGRLVGRGVDAGLSRTGVAVAALTVAVAASAGVGIMIGSFRDTVQVWLGQTLRADIYVSQPQSRPHQTENSLPASLVKRIEGLEGVASVATGFRARVHAAQGPARLFVVHLAPGGQHRFLLKRGRPGAVWRDFFHRRAVLISEPYAYRHHLRPGDRLTLRTPRGNRAFLVAGIYYDYASDQGVVLMRRGLYRRFWPGRAVASLGLFLKPGADGAQVAAAVHRLAAGQPLLVRSNRAIRRRSMQIFNRTFAITQVLRLMVMLVAFVGVLSALMALQLERRREWSVLRATGVTPRGLAGLLLGQSGLMGLIAGLLALPLGVVLAAVLIFVVNRRSFGWTMQFHVMPEALLGALGIALLAAALAGLYPALQMGRTATAAGLRAE